MANKRQRKKASKRQHNLDRLLKAGVERERAKAMAGASTKKIEGLKEIKLYEKRQAESIFKMEQKRAKQREYRARKKAESSEAFKKYASKRGATFEGFQKGEEPDIPQSAKQTQAAHNKAVNAQRTEAIYLKFRAGMLTERQRERLMVEFREEHYQRLQMQKISEMLHNNANRPGGKPFTNEQRARLEREYQKHHRKYMKAHDILEQYNIIPPKGSDLEHGYYH